MVENPECEIQALGQIFKALSNEHRLQIMGWLMNPTANFPPQPGGDLLGDGVCVAYLTEKTGLTQPSVTNHMQILQQAGLVRSHRRKNWVFYKPQPETFHQAIGALELLARKTPNRH